MGDLPEEFLKDFRIPGSIPEEATGRIPKRTAGRVSGESPWKNSWRNTWENSRRKSWKNSQMTLGRIAGGNLWRIPRGTLWRISGEIIGIPGKIFGGITRKNVRAISERIPRWTSGIILGLITAGYYPRYTRWGFIPELLLRFLFYWRNHQRELLKDSCRNILCEKKKNLPNFSKELLEECLEDLGNICRNPRPRYRGDKLYNPKKSDLDLDGGAFDKTAGRIASGNSGMNLL